MTITIVVPEELWEKWDKLDKDTQNAIMKQTEYFAEAYLKNFINEALIGIKKECE